ncbi:helicase RepA family protein [Vibrio natriegens]|uniref:helicase RepA family protein n=1 Tax=Vibrio natriegens TaxID=691 RepID=UPI0008042736|nr:helicase RepA family protein [Vibrio natriegens]ANQ16284.1 hypothetical protein BA891_03145 [Vibrio natriegens]
MNRNSNNLQASHAGTLLFPEIDNNDPFTKIRLHHDSSDTCILFYSSGLSYGVPGTGKIVDDFELEGTVEALLEMVDTPYRLRGNNPLDVPQFIPITAKSHKSVHKTHVDQYLVATVTFQIKEQSIAFLISKLFATPLIGQFGLYPEIHDACNPRWVLFVPLDQTVSPAQWYRIKEWLEHVVGVQGNNTHEQDIPCPSVWSENQYIYDRFAIAVKHAHKLPTQEVLKSYITKGDSFEIALPTPVSPIDYFNEKYEWFALLEMLGFCHSRHNEWYIPNISDTESSALVVDDRLYLLDDQGNLDPTKSFTKHEVALKWRKQTSILPVFEMMNEQIYETTGVSIKEHNRSLYPYFTDQNLSETDRQTLSKLLMSGSEGWEEETNWLVTNQIQIDSLTMIYGPTASFKSFHAIDLAACVSTGTPWGGKEVKEGAVLYIAAEGDQGVSKRIKAWEATHKKSVNKLFRITKPVALTHQEGIVLVENAITEIAKKHGKPVMIVIDTVARCFGGGDENSTKDMGEFIAACDHLRNLTGAAILLVHHTGKTPTKEARGNSSLKAALDTEFRVTRKDKKTSQGVASTGYILECTKQKDAEPQQTLFIALETVNLNESGSLNSLCRNSLPEVWNSSKSGSKKSGVQKMKVASTQSQSDCAIISSTLNENGGTTQRETLREVFNQTLPQDITSTNKRARFSRALANLEKRGSVTIEQEGSVVTAVHEELPVG